MEKNWGWSGWNPPDAGNAIQEWQSTPFGKFDGLRTLGGAHPNNDGRYVSGLDASSPRGQTAGVGGESVVEFLKNQARKLDKPFCMFISLVNPHDIGVYPGSWMKPSAWIQAGYRREDFAGLGIKLPGNYADDLTTKPKIQKRARDAYNKQAPLDTAQSREEYVNFYAYLHTVVDKHIMTVLDTLQETGLMDSTIILADHGEGGLSHGMREKAYGLRGDDPHPADRAQSEALSRAARDQRVLRPSDLLPTILDLARAFPIRNPTVSVKVSFRSCEIRHSRCRTIRSSPSMTASSSRPALLAATFGRSARAIGLMRFTSASTARGSSTNSTTSKATRVR